MFVLKLELKKIKIKNTHLFDCFILNTYICTPITAGMVKLVDMPDLGSGAARRVGSSPITRTYKLKRKFGLFLFRSSMFSAFKITNLNFN